MTKQRSAIQSLVSFRNSQGDSARGTLLRLDRSTVVFEVYNPYSIVQLSEVLQDLRIRRGERTIYRGRATVSNLVNTGLMLIVSATLSDTWRDLDGIIHDIIKVREETQRFVADWGTANSLLPGYLLSVTELRSFLGELNRWLGQIHVGSDNLLEHDQSDLSHDVFNALRQTLFPRLYELFQKFEREAVKVPADAVTLHKQYAQRDLHPLIMTAPFVHRTFTKPLGYAGDYKMVNMLMRNSNEGPTLYAKIINALHLDSGVAAAHRNRVAILADYLNETMLKLGKESRIINILNIGCGPVQEVQMAISSRSPLEHCRFRLVDFNPETLRYAKNILYTMLGSERSKPQFEFVHESVHLLLKRAVRHEKDVEEEKYDLIYCAGLFDYFSDKVCNRLLRLFYKWVKPRGAVVATNVHPSNPNRFAMEHILEWHLNYRDEKDVQVLAPQLGQQKIFCDDTGLNVFFEIIKPGKGDA